MGQQVGLASIPKLVRDSSVNAYTVILKNPVTSVVGQIEKFPYMGALVWLRLNLPLPKVA
jgi:hypothetical protein